MVGAEMLAGKSYFGKSGMERVPIHRSPLSPRLLDLCKALSW
jgi:hypothetical protein